MGRWEGHKTFSGPTQILSASLGCLGFPQESCGLSNFSTLHPSKNPAHFFGFFLDIQGMNGAACPWSRASPRELSLSAGTLDPSFMLDSHGGPAAANLQVRRYPALIPGSFSVSSCQMGQWLSQEHCSRTLVQLTPLTGAVVMDSLLVSFFNIEHPHFNYCLFENYLTSLNRKSVHLPQ